jgi:hypothetical protein
MHLLQIASCLLIGAYAPALLAKAMTIGERRSTLDQILDDIEKDPLIPRQRNHHNS